MEDIVLNAIGFLTDPQIRLCCIREFCVFQRGTYFSFVIDRYVLSAKKRDPATLQSEFEDFSKIIEDSVNFLSPSFFKNVSSSLVRLIESVQSMKPETLIRVFSINSDVFFNDNHNIFNTIKYILKYDFDTSEILNFFFTALAQYSRKHPLQLQPEWVNYFLFSK